MSSQKQIDANCANAQLSTGPKTTEGKAASRLNALKHGLTAQDAVLACEDPDLFNQSRESFQEQFQPVGPVETFLVDQIVMAAWRLTRIRSLETSLFELRLLDQADSIDEAYRGLTPYDRLAYVFHSDCGCPDAFTTLARYETRVERAFYRALHELQRLQSARAPSPSPSPLVSPSPIPRPQAPSKSDQTNPNPEPPYPPAAHSPSLQIASSPNHRIANPPPVTCGLRNIPEPQESIRSGSRHALAAMPGNRFVRGSVHRSLLSVTLEDDSSVSSA